MEHAALYAIFDVMTQGQMAGVVGGTTLAADIGYTLGVYINWFSAAAQFVQDGTRGLAIIPMRIVGQL